MRAEYGDQGRVVRYLLPQPILQTEVLLVVVHPGQEAGHHVRPAELTEVFGVSGAAVGGK
ncbi:hypothetical protein D3C83_222300 [compost metagenome]